MQKITSLFKAINILIIISIFVNTISAFPFYVFANKEEKEEEINLNSNNEINQEEVPLLYEVEDLRSDYYKVFKRADGTLQYSYYQEQVHYYENEKYVNVDASYKEEANEYIQKINKYSVKLPKKIHENKKIKLSYEDSSLEITYNDVNKVEGVITTSNIEDEKISTLKNISGSVKYPNIFNNVDLEIVSKANSFKENFIINEYINNFSFSYTMKLKKLSLIENDNLIRLVNENDEIIYEISPYYMKDANNNLSTDITCEISKTKEDEYIITITPNNDYLLHATYPVVIDPVTTYYSSSNSTSPIKTKTIVKGENTVIDGTLIVSKTGDGTLLYPGSYGIIEVTCTGLSIEPVVYAKLMIKGNSPSYVNPVIFGKLGTTSSYEEFNGNKLFLVSEKQEMVNVGDGYYTADFMPYFSGYGMNKTTFVMSPEALNINEEQEYLGHSGTTKPTLAVVQMADGGMSPYREYENVSAGEAGTIYIDRALGNMFLEKNIYNDVNGRINLSLCYSSLNKDTNVGFGNGIKTNFNEMLVNVASLTDNRKKFINGTGYTEYFYYDTNFGIYRSEDGSQRILEYNENNATYTLKDETYEKTFNSNGYLIRIITNKDSENYNIYNTINITYDTSNKIINISLENILMEFNYLLSSSESSQTNVKLIDHINIYKKQIVDNNEEQVLINKIVFTHYSDNSLETIKYYDNDSNILLENLYKYDTNKLLNKAYTDYKELSYEGVELTYDENSRVENIFLRSLKDDAGNYTVDEVMNIVYEEKKTTFTDFTGYERIYLFDYFNHTICTFDSYGYAEYYEYENFITSLSLGNPKYTYKNRLKYVSDKINIKFNPIENGSFEQNNNTSMWNIVGGSIITTPYSPYGNKMLELSSLTNSYAKQKMQLHPGTYQISLISKIISTNDDVNGYIKVCDTSGNIISDETKFNNKEFKYITHTFTLTEQKEVEIIIGIKNDAGSLSLTDIGYFDNISMGDNVYNNINNLIENSSFETLSSWTNIYRVLKLNKQDIYGSMELRILPNGSTTQEISYNSTVGDKFNLGGVVRYLGDVTKVKIRVQFYDTTNSNTTPWYVLEYNPDVTYQQYATKNIIIDGDEGTTYNKIKVEIINNGIGTAYIDNVHLYNTFNGKEYSYNESTNKIDVITSANEKLKIDYSGHKICSIETTSIKCNFTKSQIDNSFYYLEAVEQVELKNNSFTPYNNYNYYNHYTGSQITFSGNYEQRGYFTESIYDTLDSSLKSTKDEFGNSTTYEYNFYTGNISKITDALNQEYIYNDSNNDGLIDEYKEIYTQTIENIIKYEYDSYGNVKKITGNNDIIYEFGYDNYNNLDEIKLNGEIIKQYNYYYLDNINTGLVEKEINYETNYIRYEYDKYLNITACYKGEINNNIDLNEILCYNCTYTADGKIIKYNDNLENKEYIYSYDVIGRVTKVTFENNEGNDYISFNYNEDNDVQTVTVSIDGNIQTTEYYYDNNKKLSSYSIDEALFVNPTDYEDTLKRIFNEYLYIQENDNRTLLMSNSYTYDSSTLDHRETINSTSLSELSSNRIKKQTIQIGSSVYSIEYNYDSLGNIISIIYNTPNSNDNRIYNYLYEGNQLIKEEIKNDENSELLITNYSYDEFGNITSITRIKTAEYISLPGTQSFQYNENNKLISYTVDGITYTAEALDMYKDYFLTFDGSNVISMSNANQTINYTYNADGLRTSKTVGNKRIDYTYIGDNLYQEDIYISNQLNQTKKYKINPQGEVVGYEIYDHILNIVTQDAYYVKNLQNDVIKIINKEGSIIGEYSYDAYGNIINEDSLTIAARENPFRYRSYYYDVETNLFYVNSRYYSPELCRFISPDSIDYLDPESINGLNLYAYCGNNPVMNVDPSGHFFFSALLIGALVGGAIGAGVSAISQLATGDHVINPWQVLLDGTIGAVSGLLAATGIGMWGAAIVSGGLGFAGSVGGDLIESNGDLSSVNWKKAVVLGIVNFGLGAWAGAGSQNSTALGKGLLKNKEVHKTFSTLYNATNNYAAGIISKRGFTGVFNLHAGKFISAVSNALPGTVARLTAINLGKLGASASISSAIGSLF